MGAPSETNLANVGTDWSKADFSGIAGLAPQPQKTQAQIDEEGARAQAALAAIRAEEERLRQIEEARLAEEERLASEASLQAEIEAMLLAEQERARQEELARIRSDEERARVEAEQAAARAAEEAAARELAAEIARQEAARVETARQKTARQEAARAEQERINQENARVAALEEAERVARQAAEREAAKQTAVKEPDPIQPKGTTQSPEDLIFSGTQDLAQETNMAEGIDLRGTMPLYDWDAIELAIANVSGRGSISDKEPGGELYKLNINQKAVPSGDEMALNRALQSLGGIPVLKDLQDQYRVAESNAKRGVNMGQNFVDALRPLFIANDVLQGRIDPNDAQNVKQYFDFQGEAAKMRAAGRPDLVTMYEQAANQYAPTLQKYNISELTSSTAPGQLQSYLTELAQQAPQEKQTDIEQPQAEVFTEKASEQKTINASNFKDYVVENYGRANKDNINKIIKDGQDAKLSVNDIATAIGGSVSTDKDGKQSITYTPNAALTEFQQAEDQVTQLYKQELGRDPDAQGLNYYADQLAKGRSFADIQADIDASEEGAGFDAQLQQLINTQYGGFGGENSQEIVNALSDQGYSFEQIADAIGADITTNEKGETTMSYTPPAKTFTNDQVQNLITDQFGSVTPDNFQQVVDALVGAGVPVDQFASVIGANISTNDAGQTSLTLPAAETQPLSLVDQLKAQQQITGITHQASFSKDQDKIIADMAEKLGKYGVQDLADLKPITGEIEYQLAERMDNGEPTGVFNLMQRGVGPEGEETLEYAGRIATPDEINQIQTKGTVTENVGVLNSRTGEEIPVNELNNAKGSGFTYYKIEFSPDGIAVPYGYKEATGAGALGNQIKSIASLPPVAAALAAVTFGTLNTQGPGMFELGLSKPAASALAAFTSTAVGTGDLGKAAQAAILAGGSTYALQEAGLIKPGVTKPLEELTLSDFEGSGTGFGDTTDISPSDIRNILNQTSGPTLDSLSQVNPITNAVANLEIPIYGQGAQLAGPAPAGGIAALGAGLQPKVEVMGQRDTGGQTSGTAAGAAVAGGQSGLDKNTIQITGQGTKLDANTSAALSNILTSNYTPPASTDYTVNIQGTKLDAGTPGSAAAAATVTTGKLSNAVKTLIDNPSDLTADDIKALVEAGVLATTVLGAAIGSDSPKIPTETIDTGAIQDIRETYFTPPTAKPPTTPTTGPSVYTGLGISTGAPTTPPPATPTTGIGSLPVPTYKPPPFLGAQAPGASRITPPVMTADPTFTQADFDLAARDIARQQAALPPIVQMAPSSPFESGLAKGTTVAKRAGGIVALRGGGMPLAFMEGGMTAPVNQPRMLSGGGDGMSDSIPATIDGTQPARLADGEFVIPADVVADIGNGSSSAGAKQLYAMMDRIRQARHGTTKQPPEVDMDKVLPV